MAKTLEIPFVKYHGLGNDFLVALASDVPRGFPDFVRQILDRHTGVGGDGFIVVMKPTIKPHDARIRFFNADGSEAEMSGNGIRCAGAFLIERKSRKRALEIETAAGLKSLEEDEGKRREVDIPGADGSPDSGGCQNSVQAHRGFISRTQVSSKNPPGRAAGHRHFNGEPPLQRVRGGFRKGRLAGPGPGDRAK